LGDAQNAQSVQKTHGYNPYAQHMWDNRAPPPQMAHHDMYPQQYYQQDIPQQHMLPSVVNDMRYNDMGDGYNVSQSLLGLPGGMHNELLGLGSAPAPMMEHQLDPMLLAYDDQSHQPLSIDDGLTLTQHDPYEAGLTELAQYNISNTNDNEATLAPDRGLPTWDPSEAIDAANFEQTSDFEKLWKEHEQSIQAQPLEPVPEEMETAERKGSRISATSN
jgi:hypothetical protein